MVKLYFGWKKTCMYLCVRIKFNRKRYFYCFCCFLLFAINYDCGKYVFKNDIIWKTLFFIYTFKLLPQNFPMAKKKLAMRLTLIKKQNLVGKMLIKLSNHRLNNFLVMWLPFCSAVTVKPKPVLTCFRNDSSKPATRQQQELQLYCAAVPESE